jgi:hypothetical protein
MGSKGGTMKSEGTVKYWAAAEVDEKGQIVDFGRPIWGVGRSERAALRDAERWIEDCSSEVYEDIKVSLQAFPCTERLYRRVREDGGCTEYYAPGTGHILDVRS